MIEKLKAQIQADPSPATQELARQWMALFHEMVGDAPETIAQYRKASQTEPLLRMGRGMTDAMLDTIRGAMAASRAAA